MRDDRAEREIRRGRGKLLARTPRKLARKGEKRPPVALSLRHEACIVLFQGAWIVSVWIATSLTRGSARRSGSRSAFQATELEAAMFRNLLLTTDFSEVAR